MPSSGCQFWGWCPSCKNSGAAAARDVSETPLFQLWGGARTGGWPRDAPPHPFKVKLGDHFSAAPEITPGWGLAPGCGTHGTPHRCRSELVVLPRLNTTTSAIVQLSEANPQGGQRRQRTLRPSTQTLAAVLLLIGWSQRLKKTETPQRKPPKVHGHCPTISRRSQRL